MTIIKTARWTATGMVLLAVTGLLASFAGADPGPWQAGPLRLEAETVNLLLLGYLGALLWLISRYAGVNLRGQRRLGRFGVLMSLVAVSMAVVACSADLVTLAAGWTVSGFAVAGLVGHSGEPSARRAQRTVLAWMGASSVALWAAAGIAVAQGLRLDGTDAPAVLASSAGTVVAVLLLVACLIRSALAPFHRWLPETAEAPSPVSALLHAGIVNAAGIVAVLQWDLLRAQPLVLAAVGIFGVVTVAWCSLEQRVRPDVKGRLAASTSAQMGWMAVQVGVGAPAAALLHLMGHGAWKAWHFLRAGGAVARARREIPRRRESTRAETAASLALALAPVAAVVISVAALIGLPAYALLVAGLAVLAAVVVGREASLLERSSALLRAAVAALGGVTAAAYVALALAWDQNLAGAVPHVAYAWSLPLALIALGVAIALAVAGPRLTVRSSHPVATVAAATAVRPGARLRGPVAPVGLRQTEESDLEVRPAVELAARMVGPAWPLRATVAVNPLAKLESMPFDVALPMAEAFYGAPLRPPVARYVELFDDRIIGVDHLRAALEQNGADLGEGAGQVQPGSVEALLAASRTREETAPAAGAGSDGSAFAAAIAHAHSWTARAWHRAEDVDADLAGPWRLWRESAAHRSYDVAVGRVGAAAFVCGLPLDPHEAIRHLLRHHGIGSADSFALIMRLLAAGPGWTAHAQWRARRCASTSPLVELVALRLALASLDGSAARAALTESSAFAASTGAASAGEPSLQQIWQTALDLARRDHLCDRLSMTGASTAHAQTTPAAATSTRPISQSVWCIDVRSERYRRHLEQRDAHETFGYAGFFGLLGQTRQPDGQTFDQCPVIVSPGVSFGVPDAPLTLAAGISRVASRVAGRPGVAFVTAEAAGAAAFTGAVASTTAPAWFRAAARSWTEGRKPAAEETALADLSAPDRPLAVAARADAAEGMLRAIGLTSGFAPVVLLVAHGSTTENNAYVSAYDCGACGGNSGELNAAVMAGVLNDAAVRHELARRGIVIPDDTRVVAALHDTTVDTVTLVGAAASQETDATLRDDLRAAGEAVAEERALTLPSAGRSRWTRDVRSRASDWAEPMPEWGLAGCSAVVVGSRGLTREADLDGRVFLHSYDRAQDRDGTVLDALLNAPVVVSQWIAAQYWFSTAAPQTLGAGDKTTHNVVGDIGVMTGAHGDLRLGLPWQSAFAADPATDIGRRSTAHLPSRHLVVLEADPALVLASVERSAALTRLVSHAWVRVLVVDHGVLRELQPELRWTTLAADRDGAGTAEPGDGDRSLSAEGAR